MAFIKKTFQYGADTVILETGAMARQATGAVLVRWGKGTAVLVTVVANKEPKPGTDFFPLTVNYQERNYATGRIPGGYFKREGRPTEKETLTSRLMDRPLRPLFPEEFCNEVQIIATVLSADNETDPDVASMLGASAALMISGIPFNGPIGAARVGYINNAFVLNPGYSQIEHSALDLVVAGTKHAVLMVESEAKELSEEIMLEAVMFGHKEMQTAIKAIEELASEAGKAKWDWQPSSVNHELQKQVEALASEEVSAAYRIRDKAQRLTKLAEIRQKAVEHFANREAEGITSVFVKHYFEILESKIVRGNILAKGERIDGRDTKTVRPIHIETGLLPRTHGSALFTRGETQALVVTTLGTKRDAQLVDALEGQAEKNFMLHYNFPPYSVGEVGMVGSPKRREIGHGRLAQRGVQSLLPNQEEFPYVLRVVSEITESNGSSSMATVCGTSLSLMDAGVPLRAPVAGIAMGLIKEGDKFAVLTDILGDEDHLGDMDFKVAGTAKGVTALQMDIKIDGITREIMDKALQQAKDGRIHILGIMNQALNAPRENMSDYAPRIFTMKINPEKIRDVIGKGGATIRSITEETGTTIDISEDGTIKIASVDNEAAQAAMQRIHRLTAEVEVGAIYEGTVAKIMEFGAFVTILPGKDGLVHISQISKERVNKVGDKLSEGQAVKVKVLEVDKQGRIRLSIKDIEEEAGAAG